MRLWNWSAELCRLWDERAWQNGISRSIYRRLISGASGWTRPWSPIPRPIRSACHFSRRAFELSFDRAITIIVGENGPANRRCSKASRHSPATTRPAAARDTRPVDHSARSRRWAADLRKALRAAWLPKITNGWFFRAESFFSVARYLDERSETARPPPDFLSHSHGEGFLRFFEERCQRQGIYMFDEPESALSPTARSNSSSCCGGWSESSHCQVIMATHSPILMAYPGATLLRLAEIRPRAGDLRADRPFPRDARVLRRSRGVRRRDDGGVRLRIQRTPSCSGKYEWQDNAKRSICRRLTSSASGSIRHGSATARPIRFACHCCTTISSSISIAPITIILGENGVGKSTLLEGIAVLAGYDEAGGGKGYMPVDHSNARETMGGTLSTALRAAWLPKITKGWFFRARELLLGRAISRRGRAGRSARGTSARLPVAFAWRGLPAFFRRALPEAGHLHLRRTGIGVVAEPPARIPQAAAPDG